MKSRPSRFSTAAHRANLNMKTFIAATCVLSLSIFVARANPQDEEFEKIARGYIENYLAAHPEHSTELGDHRFDGNLTDYSAEARARMLANAKQTRRLTEIPRLQTA